MRRGISSRVTTILLFFLFAQLSAFAQQTLKDADPVSLYKKGKELYDNSFYASAEQAFKVYLNSKDENEILRADAQYYIAISAMELFQDDAEALINEFTREYPENPKARLANYFLGKFQWRNKKYPKAIASFEKVDPSDLDDAEEKEFYFMAGYANFQKKNYDAARTYLAKVKDIPGENQAVASYYYGEINFMQGNYKDALIEFEKIRGDKKFKTIIPVYITQIYLLQGKYEKVITTGEEALRDKSTEKFDDVKMYVAEAYFLKKDYEKAVSYYKSYNGNLNPHHMYQFGYALLMQKQYTDAIQVLNSISSNINEDSLGQDISFNLGNAYIKTGEPEKARSAYHFAAGLDFIPVVQEIALLNYAKLSFDLKYTKEAIDAFKLFIKKYPEAKHAEEAKEILSQILVSSENPKEALEVIESISNRSVKLNGAYQRILYTYGLSLYKNHSEKDTKNYTEALEYFGKSLKYPVDKKIKALAYFWAGESRYQLEDFDNALSNYKLFLAQDEATQTPYNNIAYYSIAYCYFKNENYINAKTYYVKFLESEKDNNKQSRYIDAVLRKADCNFALKDYPQARAGYEEIIEARAPEKDYALYQEGLILGLMHDDEEKIKTLRAIELHSPLADDARFAIAETYKNKGKYEQAIREYQDLNLNYPKNPYYISSLLNIGQSYINMNQDSKAIHVFNDIISKYPGTAEARQAEKSIENSYIQRGLTDSLDEHFRTHGNFKHDNAALDSSLYASAFSNISNGDCPAATKALKKYLAKFPSGFFAIDAHYYTADCEFQNESRASAIDDYNYVIAKSPNPYMETSLKNCAALYYNDKNYAMSLQRYKQLLEIANDKKNVLLSLNGELRSAFFMNQYQEAIEAANKILNLGFADDQTKHEAQFYMAKSQLELNQPDLALSNFEQVYKYEMKSDMGDESMYNAAYILYTQDKYKDAENLIYSLNHDGMSDFWKAKGLILLSDILVKTGDDFQAKSTLKTIIDNYEGEDLVKISRQKLQDILDREAKVKNGGGVDNQNNPDKIKNGDNPEKKEDKPDGQ